MANVDENYDSSSSEDEEILLYLLLLRRRRRRLKSANRKTCKSLGFTPPSTRGMLKQKSAGSNKAFQSAGSSAGSKHFKMLVLITYT